MSFTINRFSLSLSLCVVHAVATAGERPAAESKKTTVAGGGHQRDVQTPTASSSWTHSSSQVPEGAITAIYNQLLSFHSLIVIDFPICTVLGEREVGSRRVSMLTVDKIPKCCEEIGER